MGASAFWGHPSPFAHAQAVTCLRWYGIDAFHTELIGCAGWRQGRGGTPFSINFMVQHMGPCHELDGWRTNLLRPIPFSPPLGHKAQPSVPAHSILFCSAISLRPSCQGGDTTTDKKNDHHSPLYNPFPIELISIITVLQVLLDSGLVYTEEISQPMTYSHCIRYCAG